MATDTEQDFDAHELIGSSGTGANGEKIVALLLDYYPPELTAALERPENKQLTDALDSKAKARIAKIVGVERVEAAAVHGGERFEEDAWVTYVIFDDRGAPSKGAFPYPALKGAGTDVDGHVSQRASLNQSDAAAAHRNAAAKADAAAPAVSSGDPIADYEELKAPDVVAYVEANPDRAAVIGALETALRPGDERVSVMKAVKAATPPPTPAGGSTPPAGSDSTPKAS